MEMADFDPADVQAAKREVIKLGRLRGHLQEQEIIDALPIKHMLPDEIETFLFTLEMMEIEVRRIDGSLYRNAGKLALVRNR